MSTGITRVTRFLSLTARRVFRHLTTHVAVFSRLENWVARRRRLRGQAKGKARQAMNNILEEGRKVCCVWERRLKPFDVKLVPIVKVRGSGPCGGLAEVELANGIVFRGSSARTRHLFQDKERLRSALEAPTRANVIIFTHGADAKRHLEAKGCEALCVGVDFNETENGGLA